MPSEAIVEIGASVPMVSRCALDDFERLVKSDYPDLHKRILYANASVDMSAANGGKIESRETVCIPVKVDLSNRFTQTSFAIAELGNRNIPFLFSLPHMLLLDAVIDTTPNKGCLISRSTGHAYKLRKPRSHLLLDLLHPPMKKLNSLPQKISIASNWTYDNMKENPNAKDSKRQRTNSRKPTFR